MADYSKSKDGNGLYPDPEDTIAAGYSRYGPLIRPDEIVKRFLSGISLVSPMTKKEITLEEIQEMELDSIAELEAEVGISIFPTQHKERHEFDRNEYATMGYMRLRQRPVTSVQDFSIVASNNVNLWNVSLDWIDPGYLTSGLVYIVPINVAVSSQSSGGGAGGAAFLAILGQQSWVPAYWQVTYTTGFDDGKIPRDINVLIGLHTAIDILGQLAAARAAVTSKSIGIDGLSQSSSGPGPQVYDTAIKLLQGRKKVLVGKIKNSYGLKMFSGNV